MEVRGREKFPFSGRDPTLACLRLALGAVTISAAIEGVNAKIALGAFVAVSAQRCRAAIHDRAHHLHLLKTDSVSMTVDEGVALRAKDVGHLHRWAGHGFWFLLDRFTISSLKIERVSTGLTTACK
jgi:hypothetical protein